MISTEHKTTTLRTATARAVLHCSPHAMALVQSRQTPKGDALEVARVAGTLAAKKTAELIPYCHPIPLDQVAIAFACEATRIIVTARVTAIWKTGVEMEALVAVQIAAVTLFDMLKMIDTAMRITDIAVVEKTGGKSSFVETIPPDFRAAVIVTSDGTAAGTRQDRSGRIITERLERYGIAQVEYRILPDDADRIERALVDCYERRLQLVITTGGTGVGPRDVTVEATQRVIDREIPGIMETARGFGQSHTPYAMLSRGVAGLKGEMLIINLPGSSRGTAESLDAIFPAVLHSYRMMGGGGH